MISGANANAVQQKAKPYYASTMDIGFQDLERLKAKARIPVMSGTAGNVLSVLQQRIGHQPLDIKNIADCLQLSKRTLQRRLKEHMVSFVDLRDRVRFNCAIDCLLIDGMSIEATSKHLDFSDRTSFTNAFKRWSDLSPSAFRKLYRDYV